MFARSKARLITREKIIKDCATLMAEKGYFSASISELEKITGKSKAVLYGYFMNKHEFAMAVLDYNLEQNRNAIDKVVKLGVDNRSKLMAHVLFHYPKTENTFAGNGCQLFNSAFEAGSVYDEMRKRLAKALLLWKQDLVEIIEDGIRRNEFKYGLSVNDTAWQLITLIEGAAIISKTTQSRTLGIQLLDQAKCLVSNL